MTKLFRRGFGRVISCLLVSPSARQVLQILVTVVILCSRLMNQVVTPTGESVSQVAHQALEHGNYKRAEELYRNMVRTNPSSPEFLNNLGISLYLQGKSSEAIQYFEKALRLREMPGTLALLGLNYCKAQQYRQAAAILQRAKRYFADSSVLVILGPCYLEAGEALDAVAVYQELFKRGTPPVDKNAVNLARAYFRASKYFIDLLEKAPQNEEYMNAIVAARENGSLDAGGASPTALNRARYVHPGMSVEELAKFLPGHQQDPALLYLLGVTCGEHAMQTFLLCENRYPDSPAVRRLKAEVLSAQGLGELALGEYGALLRASAVPSGVHHDLAMLYRKKGEWEKALNQFQQEKKTVPTDEGALAGISECLLHLGRFEELREYLKPVIMSKSPPEWALLYWASSEEALGRVDGAIHYLQLAEKQNPKSQTVHYRLSQLYHLDNLRDLGEQEMMIYLRLRQTNQKTSGGAETKR